MAPPSRNSKRAPRSWAKLDLPEWCLEAIASMGFSEPTPSQAAAIPLFLANSDVVVEAPTGSGKSLAFLLPLVVRILRRFEATEDSPATPIKRGHVAAVVLAPTRELADQLHRVLLDLVAFHPPTAAILPYVQQKTRSQQAAGKKTGKTTVQLDANGLQIIGDDDNDNDPSTPITPHTRRPDTTGPVIVPQLVVGGSSSKPAADLSQFVRQGSNVIVGTPGRLTALLSSKAVNATASFEALVLDEADRLLDLGFASDLQSILAYVPKQRRTFLCSASVNDAIGELIKVNLRNPKRIVVRVQTRKQESKTNQAIDPSESSKPAAPAEIEEKKTPASLLNTYIALPSSHKLPGLVQILTHVEPRPLRTLVFMASCFSVKYFASVLPDVMPEGYTVLSLHGKLEPHVREKAFARFLATTSPCVLLTTDVASRGLDVPNVDLVVNIDPPTDPKTFLHRCGRTGRAGRRGLAVTMLRPGREEEGYVPFLAVRKTPVEQLGSAVPSLAEIPLLAENTAAKVTEGIRAQVQEDRELHQLGQRAFVSWARAFQEHKAGSIFRPGDLDWIDLGHAWGLVRLPKMPELRAAEITDRSLGLTIDVEAIQFKDKIKEKRRQAELRAAALAAAAAAVDEENGIKKPNVFEENRKRNAPWSGRQGKDELRTERREKRQKKKQAERYAAMTPAEREEQAKVDAMVAEVRKQTIAAQALADAEGGEFNGFDD